MAIYDDPLQAAQRRFMAAQPQQSYFPAANLNRFSDNLTAGSVYKPGGVDDIFFTGQLPGQTPPTPTPTTTPTPKSYFGAQPNSRFTLPATPQFNFGMNGRGNQMQDWLKQYGWSS